MHRTTTTAALLVTVTVSALSGCVTVQRPPVPGPPTAPGQPPAPGQPSAPRSGGQSEPQIVQAPAREALELIGPSRHPDPTPPDARGRSAGDRSPERNPPGHSHAHPRPAHPKPDGPKAKVPQQPQVKVPDVSESVRKDVEKNVQKNGDVCAMGKKHGGWQADSAEATICRQTYGR
ncbi:hypothetical protein AQJ91_26940 [Streptomyces dysideae]|uniref:Lipoprotein n=1 Tax=Streptomyces dysideae TaxID=909626 RepID=A0A101UW97_9ACTN|nr:hypothetical protein AQJ91_26940 [Streptomyces dysideae]